MGLCPGEIELEWILQDVAGMECASHFLDLHEVVEQKISSRASSRTVLSRDFCSSSAICASSCLICPETLVLIVEQLLNFRAGYLDAL